MGRGTYEVIQELRRVAVYDGKRTIVVSRSPGLEVQTEKTELFSGELTELIERLSRRTSAARYGS